MLSGAARAAEPDLRSESSPSTTIRDANDTIPTTKLRLWGEKIPIFLQRTNHYR